MSNHRIAALNELIQALSGEYWHKSVKIDLQSVRPTLPHPQSLFSLGESISMIPARNLRSYLSDCQKAFVVYDQSRKSTDKSALTRLASSRSQNKRGARTLPDYPLGFAFDSVFVFIAVCETVVSMLETIDKMLASETPQEEDMRLQKKLDKWIGLCIQGPGAQALQENAESILQDERKALLA